MPLWCGLAVALTSVVACHGQESVPYVDDGSLMLLQTRASMMKISVDNLTDDASVELVDVKSGSNISSGAHSGANATDELAMQADQMSSLALTAPLTEDGYAQVLALQNNAAMEKYATRVGADLDIAVSATGKRAMKGFVPWFSGEKANRTLLRLQNEMTRISKIPRSWLTRKGASSPLNEVGLAAVASLHDNSEMEKFVSRVALEIMDQEVTQKEKLSGMVPFYSGVKAKKGFDVLLNELDAVVKSNSSWLNLRHKALQHAGEDCMPTCNKAGYCDWCGSGNACCKKASDSNPAECKGQMSDYKTDQYECVAIATGQTATMDYKGYAALVALKNDTQMERFVRRKAAKMDMTVKSDQALRGFVPFFSGTKGTRPYGALEVEMRRISHKANGWLAARGSTAPLNNDGYQTVASLGSSLEMAEFVHRVAADMKLDIVKEEGLKGMVPYYSGERTKSNYTALQAEITRVAEKPDGTGWVTKRKDAVPALDKAAPASEKK